MPSQKDASLIASLADGAQPPPSDLLDALEPTFPLIGQMAETPQDPEWHAEGSVRIHTEMVIAESYKLTDGLSPERTQALVLSAALHDVGKPLVTREEKIKGKIRITSPRHAGRGRSYAAPLLPQLELADEINTWVLAGIGHHHDPRKMLTRNAKQSRFWRFARLAEAKMIYLLEMADTRGRTSVAPDAHVSDTVELFQVAAEEHGIWDQIDPYSDWDETIRERLCHESDGAISYAQAEARRQFEAGNIFTPEEAIAKTHEHRQEYAELVVTCAPSGSGKSQWIDENLPSHTRISLDEIREELTGRRDRMNKEGQVMQLAKKRLREALAAKQKVVWDATCTRKDGRSAILSLGHDYHALTTIVAFAIPPAELMRRNQNRKHQIPSAVIEKQLAALEWPSADEAHYFVTVR